MRGPDFPPEELLDEALDEVLGYANRKYRKPDRRKRRRRRSDKTVAKKREEVEQVETEKRESPITLFARQLGDYKTTQEVADLLGVSAGLIRKFARNGVPEAPSYVADIGHTNMALYTDEDVDTLRRYLASRHKVKKAPGKGTTKVQQQGKG